jgi:PAS domain S-box-containing protein
MTQKINKEIFYEGEGRAALESIFNAANLGMIISNAEGTIQQVNPYTNQLFGYEEGELVGQKIEVLIPPGAKERHVGHRETFNKNPRTRAMGLGMDLSACKKDGTLFPVEISLTHYERNGKKEIVSFVSDITERKKLEEELKTLNVKLEKKVEERTKELAQAFLELQQINQNLQEEMGQRQRAEQELRESLERERELSELKSRFVSIASHEFRTPLSGILSSASLISRYRDPMHEEKREKHVGTIKASVHSLTNILNDFLSLDKLEKGKTEYSPREFPLQEWARDLCEEMQELTKPRQRIVCCHQGEEGSVFLDPQLLRSIFMNLLSNAIKYSSDGQEIYFSTQVEGLEVSMVVRDQGLGIPEKDQKHLFETFFRAKNVTGIQGTGLGLHIVKRSLDLMGGKIRFNSEENVGSSFEVKLPRRREA